LISLRAHQAARSVEGDPGFAWETGTNTSLEIRGWYRRIATLLLCDAASAHKFEPVRLTTFDAGCALVDDHFTGRALVWSWPRTAPKTKFVAIILVIVHVLANAGTPAFGILTTGRAAGTKRPLLVAISDEFSVVENRSPVNGVHITELLVLLDTDRPAEDACKFRQSQLLQVEHLVNNESVVHEERVASDDSKVGKQPPKTREPRHSVDK